jgi:hypothetical protein
MPVPNRRFRTAYEPRERHYISTGNGYEPEYAYEINKQGQKELVKIGEINVYEMIQSHYEETKIENILASVAAGDTSMLRPDGIYADITGQPKSLLEARQQIQHLENMWYGLPAETREKYDNNLEKFVNESGSEKWLKDMGYIKEIEVEELQPNNTETEGGDKK